MLKQNGPHEKHRSCPLWPAKQVCGARTRAGTPCKNWPIRGRSRCRLHGGKSTGPRTSTGKQRTARNSRIDGFYDRVSRNTRRELSECIREFRRAVASGRQADLKVLRRIDEIVEDDLSARHSGRPESWRRKLLTRGGVFLTIRQAMELANLADDVLRHSGDAE